MAGWEYRVLHEALSLESLEWNSRTLLFILRILYVPAISNADVGEFIREGKRSGNALYRLSPYDSSRLLNWSKRRIAS